MHEMSRTTVTVPVITATAVRGTPCDAVDVIIVAHDSIGTVGSSARIARRIGTINASAGFDVRTTYRAGHQLRTVRYSTGWSVSPMRRESYTPVTRYRRAFSPGGAASR